MLGIESVCEQYLLLNRIKSFFSFYSFQRVSGQYDTNKRKVKGSNLCDALPLICKLLWTLNETIESPNLNSPKIHKENMSSVLRELTPRRRPNDSSQKMAKVTDKCSSFASCFCPVSDVELNIEVYSCFCSTFTLRFSILDFMFQILSAPAKFGDQSSNRGLYLREILREGRRCDV